MSIDTDTTSRVLVGRPAADGWDFGEDPIVAATYPDEPPRDWFTDPKLTGPTMLTIEDSGRVYGHAADWTVPHLGLPGRYAPKSKTGYRYFLSGNTKTAEGDVVRTGHLTVGGGHADLQASASDAKAHYDDVSTCFADVVCGEDAYGWWVAGALRSDVTAAQVRAARGSSLSGDWRPVREGLEAVAAHAVNTPGFGITQPLAQVASAADGSEHITALIAAGMIQPRITIPTSTEDVTEQEDTAMAETVTPDVPEEEPVTAGAAPTFTKDQVVKLLAEQPIGLVAAVAGDTATVTFEVPVAEITDAGPDGRAALTAATRERLADTKLAEALGEIKALREDVQGMVASAEAKQRGADALGDLALIPDAEGN